MEEQKTKSKSKKIFLVIFIVIVIAILIFLFKNQFATSTLKIPFPFTSSVVNNTSFACESLIFADVVGSPEEYLGNGIEGSVQESGDKIAMNIKNEETLNFLTITDVEAGTSEGEDWLILQNDNEKLMAVWYSERVISTLVINKTNGLGVWLKGNSDYFSWGSPSGFVAYLTCR